MTTSRSTSQKQIQSFDGFKKQLTSSEKPDRAVLFFGSESYLINQSVSLFINSVLDENNREFGLTKLDGDSTNWQELDNALRSQPMFVDQKVVILRDIKRLPVSARKGLTDYFTNPSENTWLGLIDTDIDWRKKPYSTWATLITRVQCDPFAGDDLTLWIQEYVKAAGFDISDTQAEFLASISDGDMQIISGILDKVFLLLEPDQPITDPILETAAGSSQQYSWDALLAAVADRDMKSMWQIIDYLHRQAPSATYFTQILSRTFQGALIAQQFQGNIPFDMSIYRSIGYFGKSRQQINRISKSFSREEMEDALSEIKITDRELKSTSKSTAPMIYQLMGKIVIS
jgi:DNA polymerase-3 subunit delta